jgi:hypothetical protein
MSNSFDNLSVHDIRNGFRTVFPELAQILDLKLASSYADFVACVNRGLDDVIELIQGSPNLRQADSEDRITIEIVVALKAKGFDAGHDTMTGGHTDILVKKDNFTWIAEAKIHRSNYTTLMQGFNQLTTRYANGTLNNSHGCLLIYIKDGNAAQIVERWKSYLTNEQLPGFSSSDATQLDFSSQHTHAGSGLPYAVRHIGVVLNFNPQA